MHWEDMSWLNFMIVHRILTSQGIMVAQSESPRFNIPVFKEIFICNYYVHLIDCCSAVISLFSTDSQEDLWQVSLAMVRMFPVTG